MANTRRKSSGREFRTFTVAKRGKDHSVRVPQFSEKLSGDALIRAVAKAAYVAASDDVIKALQLMEEWVTADYKLNIKIVRPMINLMCRQQLDALVRATRPQIRGSVIDPSKERLEGIRKVSDQNRMNFPIRFGLKWIRLGDCIKEELLAAADQREKSAKTMNSDAIWFRRIAKELTGKQKVEDALKPADIDKFFAQAHKDVA